jgi:hypothetical protein
VQERRPRIVEEQLLARSEATKLKVLERGRYALEAWRTDGATSQGWAFLAFGSLVRSRQRKAPYFLCRPRSPSNAYGGADGTVQADKGLGWADKTYGAYRHTSSQALIVVLNYNPTPPASRYWGGSGTMRERRTFHRIGRQRMSFARQRHNESNLISRYQATYKGFGCL